MESSVGWDNARATSAYTVGASTNWERRGWGGWPKPKSWKEGNRMHGVSLPGSKLSFRRDEKRHVHMVEFKKTGRWITRELPDMAYPLHRR